MKISFAKFANNLQTHLSLIALVATLAACGDGSNTGNTGGGGSGGENAGGSAGMGGSATGGTGGGGGSSANACSAEQSAIIKGSWPWFGFEDPTPDLSTMQQGKVDLIDAFGMDISFDAGGVPARFTWAGAALNAAFAVGDIVTAQFDPNVQSYAVYGSKGKAIAMRYAKGNLPATLPAIPEGGPSLSLEATCTLEETKMCPMPEHRTLYSLHADLSGMSAVIPSGQTAQIGTWQVHHIKTMYSDFYTVGDCIADHFFDGMVHALYVNP